MRNLFLILVSYTVFALGAPGTQAAPADAPAAGELVAMSNERALDLPPMLMEIRTVLLEQLAAAAPLRTALDQASDPAEIRDLEREIAVLRAERAFLLRPERIEPLAREIKMRPVTGEHFTTTEALNRARAR